MLKTTDICFSNEVLDMGALDALDAALVFPLAVSDYISLMQQMLGRSLTLMCHEISPCYLRIVEIIFVTMTNMRQLWWLRSTMQ